MDTCYTQIKTTLLAKAKYMRQYCEHIVDDLDTIEGMQKSMVIDTVVDTVVSNLNMRIFDNLVELDALTNELMDANITQP